MWYIGDIIRVFIKPGMSAEHKVYEYPNALYKGFIDVEDTIESFRRFSGHVHHTPQPVTTIVPTPIGRMERDSSWAEIILSHHLPYCCHLLYVGPYSLSSTFSLMPNPFCLTTSSAVMDIDLYIRFYSYLHQYMDVFLQVQILLLVWFHSWLYFTH